jgi:HK97 family phage major capsid protein
MSDLDIKSISDEIRKEFKALRDDVETVKGRDVVDEAKFNKLAEDITGKLAALQAENAKTRAALDRPGAGGNGPDLSEHKSVMEGYLRKGRVPANVEVTDNGLEIRSMSTQVPADGGYLVRPELADFVVSRVFESSPVRAVARVITIGTDTLDVIMDDNETAAAWVTETQAPSVTAAPKLGQKAIAVHELSAMPRASNKMLEDGILDVEMWLARAVAEKFARTEATAFVTGDGVGKPRGILSYPAWAAAGVYERDKIEQVPTGVSTNIGADGFVLAQGSLKEAYQGNAVWMMKRLTYARALTLKGADQFYFGQTFLRDGQLQAQLLGRPVFFADDFANTATNGNLAYAYGDFGVGYTIVDRIGLQVLRDPFYAKPFVQFYTRKRVGGDVTNFDAIKLGKVGTS